MTSMVLLSTCIGAIVSALVAWRVTAVMGSPQGNAEAAVPRYRTVQAEQFLLTDEQGRICAELSTQAGLPQLVFFNQEGKKRATFRVHADNGPALLFLDNAENPRTFLGLDAQSFSKLALSSMDGKEQVVLTGQDNGSALLLCDRAGQHRVGLIAGEDGLSGLSLFDSSNTNRATLSVIEKGISSFVLMNEAGEVVWQAP
jgi:hypothetical protein